MKTVGLCNEWVGATFNLSLAARLRHARPRPGARAASTTSRSPPTLRVNGEDALRQAARADGRSRARGDRDRSGWIRPPTMKWIKVSPADALVEARRDREQPRCASRSSAGSACSPAPATTTRSSSCPASCTPATTTAAVGACTTTAWQGHRADAVDDVEHYESVRDATDVIAHAVGRARRACSSTASSPASRGTLPVNLPNEGNVTNLPDGCGRRDHGRRRRRRACAAATTTTVPGIMGEFLRRINVVQEWTVEAAVTGDRTLVLEAMIADPMAGAARLRRHRHDDRRDARRHRPLAPAVRVAS